MSPCAVLTTPRPQSFAGPRLGQCGVVIENTFDEYFDPAPGCLTTIQSRGDNACVIKDEQVPSIEKIYKLTEPGVGNHPARTVEA